MNQATPLPPGTPIQEAAVSVMPDESETSESESPIEESQPVPAPFDASGTSIPLAPVEDFNQTVNSAGNNDIELLDIVEPSTNAGVKDIEEAMQEFIEKGYEIKENFDPKKFNNDIMKKIEKLIN